ncbi:von Willebrand factor A domain-containing protein 2 isoform X4 [Balearica regulorum gibbericeps]|uniref:von Willebrand factor A domain-containing protein 2 isoform X4 n=1 Tax=Balearica regulorum gibbericeps TaxID=100784 RepID=UPI003F5FFC19
MKTCMSFFCLFFSFFLRQLMGDYLFDPTVLLALGIQEIHADQEMMGKISAAGQLMQCSASLDVLFLLDGSYSIGKGSFERSKHFAGKLCDALDIHPDRVRVGMIQFSSTPHLEFPLDSYLTKEEVKERIKRIVFRWKRVLIKHPSRCFRTVCSDPCDSQPCQNGGTCVPEGLDKYHCLCPVGYGGDIHCAPKLSLECDVDLLFLMDSSAGVTLEGFLRYKAFLKRFLQAVMGQDSPMNVGVAQYDNNVKIPIEVGQHKDAFSLMKSIDALNFSGGGTLTGRALQYIAQHGFRSTPVFADMQDDLPRVVVLLTDSKSQDPVAEAAKYARDRDLFLIGVGSSFMKAELTKVTGNPKQTIIYSDPQDLFNRIPELQRRICNVDNPEGCQAQSLDLAFALDASSGVGLENFLRLRSFVRSSCLHFSINRDVTQIALVIYGSKAHTVFALDTHTSNSAVLQAISQVPFLGDLASAGSALLHIYGDVMTVQKGARPGVNKVVVMLTNGDGMEDAAAPAQQLRDNGISVFVVVLGDARADVLLRVAGSPNYLVHVSSYEDLQYYQGFIIERICEEAKSPVNLCKPNPCMNQGVCILGPGSYRCECRGWEGPHCESRVLRGDSPRSLVLLLHSRVQQSSSGLQHFSRASQHTKRHVDQRH